VRLVPALLVEPQAQAVDEIGDLAAIDDVTLHGSALLLIRG
jgi:hypothetical protein